MPPIDEMVITTDHDEIRRWAEHNHMRPWIDPEGPGRLALDPEGAFMTLLTWEEFFHQFEEAGLAFVYRRFEGDDGDTYELIKRAMVV
jgi:hypothetical protein